MLLQPFKMNILILQCMLQTIEHFLWRKLFMIF